MRKALIVLTAVILIIQGHAQDNLRKELTELVNKNQNQKGLLLADKMLINAKSTDNHADYIFAVVQKLKILPQIYELDNNQIYDSLIYITGQAPVKAKSALKLMEATLLSNQYFSDKWSIEQKPDDGIENILFNEMSKHDYYRLVNNAIEEALLYAKKGGDELIDYKELFFSDDYFLNYFPKMVDQIYYQGIALLSEFDNNNHEFESEHFSNISSSHIDSKPLSRALELFEQWYNTNISEHEILGYIELTRTEWINKRNDNLQKFELYESTLKDLSEKYKEAEINADILLSLARHYRMLSQKYNPEDSTTALYYGFQRKSLDMVGQIMQTYPNHHTFKYAQNIKNDIELKKISVCVEKYNMSDKNMAVSISYSNISKIKITVKQIKGIDIFVDGWDIDTKNSKVVFESWFDLPKTSDFYKHTTTLVVPYGKTGSYVIEVSTDNEIEDIAKAFFHITQMTMFTEQSDITNTNVWIVNANNGDPITNAKIEVLSYEYGARREKKREKIKNIGTYTVKNGFATIPTKTLLDSRLVRVINGNDTLLQNCYPTNYNKRGGHITDRIEMFTDRNIYRPGQTILVKGIWYKGSDEIWNIVEGQSTTLYVRDNNYTEIASYNINTNKFGSFSASIAIPEDIEPGYLTLETYYGGKFVKIESYRRYTFDAIFTNPEKAIKPGDEVVIKLEAKTFSGAKLSNLKIKGDITLNSQYVWWIPQTGKTIAVIDTLADENGSVTIRFKSSKNISYQTYNIKITATTQAGESRDFTHSYTVSDYPYKLSIDNNKIIKGDMLPKINIGLINGGKPAEQVELSLELLSPPKNVLLKSTLPAPDKHLFSLQEWQKLMPLREYNCELRKENFKVAKNYWYLKCNADNAKFGTELQNSIDEGTYRLTMIAEGKKYTEYFTVVNPGKKGTSLPELVDIYPSTYNAEIGQEITITFVSAVNNINVWYGISAGNKTIEQKRIIVKNGKHTIKLKIDSQYEGTIFVNSLVIYGGKKDIKTTNINVARQSKQLDIETITMRNRILPGEQETWKFKIKTPDGRPLNAEILASMYDKSLDVFTGGQTRTLSIYYPSTNTTLFSSDLNRLISGNASLPGTYILPPTFIQWDFFGYSNLYYKEFYHDFDTKSGYHIRTKMTPYSATQIVSEQGYTGLEEIIDDGLSKSESLDNTNNDKTNEQSQATKAKISSVRTNLKETAFFYPFLEHDQNGEFSVNFESPEALTSWKLQLFAHDQKLSTGYFESNIETHKPLMVMPIFPRFAYTNDKLTINASVFNQTDSMLTIQTGAQIVDIQSGEEIETEISDKQINLKPGESKSFAITIRIPTSPGFLSAKIFAQTNKYIDGEENIIPVWPNMHLVTNTLALWGKSNSTTEYKFDNMLPSEVKDNNRVKLTIEMATNPTWYAIQSLSFFNNPNQESPYRLVESLFGVQTGKNLINQFPEISKTLNVWKKTGISATQSKLLTNNELKIKEIEKTPWYLDAINEQEQKYNLSLFLDKNNIEDLTKTTIRNLNKIQHNSGAFSWVPGWFPSTYTTLYVSELIGKLKKQNIDIFEEYPDLGTISNKALTYLDNELERGFMELIKSKSDTAKYMTSYQIVRHLYIKSLLVPEFKPVSKAEIYYFKHAKKYALDYNLYGQAILGTLARSIGEIKLATQIYNALNGSAVVHNERGLFWRQNIRGWEWYQAPISTQVRIMEFYQSMNAPTEKIEAMKVWLISHKRTHMWNDGPSTAESIYALITAGKNWLTNNKPVTITIPDLKIVSSDYMQHDGTGYFKTIVESNKIPSDIKSASIENPNSNPVFGGIYSQFYENFDKIKSWQQNLNIKTSYFAYMHHDKEVVLEELKDHKVKQGSKIKVRITVTSDRELEYVVIQMPFPACFEQVNQASGFQWKFGESYYINNYDNRTEFLFHRLKQGVSVIEFDLYTLRSGEYLSAPTSIQSLYAPEFGAHTTGVKFLVE